ncbi:hypothetical protein [Brevundimonas variabilis]|uniref:Lipoprotein n=1 Tax=Brevundimonas variabilis TaxID=74312 RepID=A0A7W9CKZ8_9CAUL|nr:hypothetical protein [Brevundimonas variabilis]MBB5747638.1 hypothetical protein [Brevundimonas variabilis]
MELMPRHRNLPTFFAFSAMLFASACSREAEGQSPLSSGPGPRESLEWMVLHEINGANFDRSYPFEQSAPIREVPEGVIIEVNVSDDGVADWLVDYSKSGLNYCGTGGCLKSLFVSDADTGYILAFDDQTLDFAIGDRNDERVIDVSVHRVMCSPFNDDCTYAFAWDPALKRLVERPNRRGETLVRAPIGVLDPSQRAGSQFPEAAPEALQRLWRDTAKACPAPTDDEGLSVAYATIHSVPDLDGDRVRDWFFQAPAECPGNDTSYGEQQPYRIYVSRAGQDPELAFTSRAGEQPLYDVASRPAILISNPDCGSDSSCPNIRLKWDTRTQRFDTTE